MVIVVDITVFFIISTFVTTLRSCEFEVDNPVDGKDIKEEETMEVVDWFRVLIFIIGPI